MTSYHTVGSDTLHRHIKPSPWCQLYAPKNSSVTALSVVVMNLEK